MAYSVRWTDRARRQREEALLYGKEVWGVQQARMFWDHLREEIKNIAQMPTIGKPEPLLCHIKPQTRSFVLHSHYKLVYQIYEEQKTIYVIGLWDTRKDPTSNL